MVKRTCLVAGLSLLPLFLSADHLPDNEIARGKSDAVLSGVNVYGTTIARVEKRLGSPALTETVPETGIVAGGRNYEWRRPGVRLIVGTWNDKGESSIAYSVEVWGRKPDGVIGVTGRGLTLGSTLRAIRQIYGSRFRQIKRDDGTQQITIQWQDETTLELYLDRQDQVNHMHLLASTE
jgi:hypothetical protein